MYGWIVSLYFAEGKTHLKLFIPWRQNASNLFLWHSSPNLLKAVLSHSFSQHLCCLHYSGWYCIYHFNGTNSQQNPERSDLQSWIRVKISPQTLPFSFYDSLFLWENWHHLMLSLQSSLSPIIPGTKLPWHWVNPCLFQFCFQGKKTDKKFR